MLKKVLSVFCFICCTLSCTVVCRADSDFLNGMSLEQTKKESACRDAYLQVIENMAESGEISDADVMGYAQIELEGAEYPILLIHSYTGNEWLSYQDGTVLSGTYPFGSESTYQNMLVLQSSPSYSDNSKKIESSLWIRYEVDDDGALAIKDYYAQAVSEWLGLGAPSDSEWLGLGAPSDEFTGSPAFWNAHDELSSEEDIPANPNLYLYWDGDLNEEFYDEYEAEHKDVIDVSRLSELPLFKNDELAFEAETEPNIDSANSIKVAADNNEEWEAVRSAGMRVGYPITVPGDFYTDGQEQYKETGYILPQSATKYLTEEDVAHLSMKGCCYARNEIYARHGRQFNASELKDYFTAQTWYEGTVSPDDFTDNYSRSVFNDYEYQNATFLWDYETENGMYWPE